MKTFADLQIHTNFSDGIFDPMSLLNEAHFFGLKAFSFTDHNYLLPIDIINTIREEATKKSIIFIEAVEISSTFQGVDFHLLVYSKKFERNNQFIEMLQDIHKEYENRGIKAIEELSAKGFPLSDKDFSEFPHTYLSKNLIMYIANKKYGLPFEEVKKIKLFQNIPMVPFEKIVALMNKCKGIPILAHPGSIYKKFTQQSFEEFLNKLAEAGLEGIEYHHYRNTDKDMLRIVKKIIGRYKLTLTGGSDYHSDWASGEKIGSYGLNKEEFDDFYSKLP